VEALPSKDARKLRVALISPHYPPMRTSAAVQVRDLALEMIRQGHEPVVIVPAEELNAPWEMEIIDGVQVLRLVGPSMRYASYLRRAVSELLLPFFMIRGLYKSPLRNASWDLVAWYSPTIFFGPLIWVLKRTSGCRTYLILRDIFPEWALDLGLLRKGPVYWLFKSVAKFQYAMANTIGVQTPSNLGYLANWGKPPGRNLEVLQNWQTPVPDVGSSIVVKDTPLAGRKIFVYIGNMGVAQGMDIFIDLADQLKQRTDLGFLFVGRGSELSRLKASVAERALVNTLFFDEVDSREMPGLLAQCEIGMLALDPRHKTHNIPGKFLTYLLAGLPVLARVNAGTDLAHLIENEGVGRVYVGESVAALRILAEELADSSVAYEKMASRGRFLAERMFSPATAVRQIIATAPDCLR
jgi:glycosyltransferase involved in cell wall biosynthesis